MRYSELPLKGAYIVELDSFEDNRGWFARTYCKNDFKLQIGHDKEWVQMNHSFTKFKGTIRGMHFQINPHEEIKMVRCIAGAVYDVVIDLRRESSTFLKYFGVELSAENRKMIYIPEGFAHGFQSLLDNSELIYHHSEFYKPNFEAGIRYDDPIVNIKWRLPLSEISERDRQHKSITEQFKGI